jgi:hypothetical protein
VLTAVEQFRVAANAAAMAWAHRPAYVGYIVDVAVDVPSLNRHQHIVRSVEERTKDDVAVLRDLPRGQEQVDHAFPIDPTFDALSYFHLNFRMGDPVRMRNPLSDVVLDAPITFATPQASSEAVTVLATSLRNYFPSYAPDSNEQIAHIITQPLPALTTNNASTFYLHDIYVDTTTNLPTRVVYHGSEADFALDYAILENHWIVKHVFYRRTFFAPLHLGQVSFTVDATYTQFAFPAEPIDARLRS